MYENDSDVTDEDEVPKIISAEYQWRVQREISVEEDEYNITHVKIPWSGEDVMQQINPKYFLFDWKSLIHFSRVLDGYNWSPLQTDIWEGGFEGLFQAFRRLVRDFALGKWFDYFIMLSVLGNTIVLAMDGLLDSNGNKIVSQWNLGFTYVFTIDMFLKMFGMGVAEYLKDGMNTFDAIIVSLSLIELFFFGGGGSAISAFRSVRIFRTFRVLRVTRLVR